MLKKDSKLLIVLKKTTMHKNLESNIFIFLNRVFKIF